MATDKDFKVLLNGAYVDPTGGQYDPEFHGATSLDRRVTEKWHDPQGHRAGYATAKPRVTKMTKRQQRELLKKANAERDQRMRSLMF